MSSGDFVTQALSATAASPTGTITGTNQVILITSGFSGAAFTVSGTFTGTAGFFASADGGANWFPCNVAPSGSSTPAISTTAPGLFRSNVSGYTHVAICMTALASGVPTVSIHCSETAAMFGGGGGGAGAVTSLTTTGTSGASALTSGVLNIPVYAAGAVNVSNMLVQTDASTTSNTQVSTGQGTTVFQSLRNPYALVVYNLTIKSSVANSFFTANVYRNPSIPALNAATAGPTILTQSGFCPSTANTIVTIAASLYDPAVPVGAAVYYYLGFQSNGSATFTIVTGSVLQVMEAK